MGRTKQEIEILIGTRIFGEKAIEKLKKRYRELSRSILESNRKTAKGIGIQKANRAIVADNIKTATEQRRKVLQNRTANQGFFRTLRMGQQDWSQFNKQGGVFNKRGGKLANTLRKSTSGLKGFRMEMLGVMFFGMAMARMFSGLLKTSLEWTGVTKIMSTALGLLFLPVALILLRWAIKFLKWVLGLTDAQRLWIGKIVLLGIALGTVLFVLGAFTLGLGSLLAATGTLLLPLGLLFAAFALLGGLALLPILFKKMSENSEELEGKIVGLGVSAESIKIVKDAMVDWADIIENKVTGAIDNLTERYETFKASVDEAGGLGAFSGDKVTEVIDALLTQEQQDKIRELGKRTAETLIEGIKEFLIENPLVLIGAIVGLKFGGIMGAAAGAAIGLAINKSMKEGGVVNDEFIKGAASSALAFADSFGTWIGENTGKLVALGVSLSAAIFVGFSKGLMGKVIEGWNNLFRAGNQLKQKNFGLPITDEGGFQFPPPPREHGGLVSPNKSFIVGERGPELFTPNSAGNITPNGQFGGNGSNITNNFYGFTMEDLNRELDARDSILIEQIRRNG